MGGSNKCSQCGISLGVAGGLTSKDGRDLCTSCFSLSLGGATRVEITEERERTGFIDALFTLILIVWWDVYTWFLGLQSPMQFLLLFGSILGILVVWVVFRYVAEQRRI